MPDLVSTYRDAGFSDDEIQAHLSAKRELYKGAGFSDDEIDAHFGMPKTPKGIPPAFVQRMVQGAKFAAEISGIPKTFSEAWEYGQGIGHEAGKETVDAVKNVVSAFNPVSEERRAATESVGKGGQGLFDEGMKQTGAGLLAVAALPFAPLQGALHAIASGPIVAAEHTLREGAVALHGEENVAAAEKETGSTPGGMSKEDANKLIDTALMGMGNRPISRIEMGPGGVPDVQQIGGLPRGEDFSTASTAIGHGDTTPAMEGKLLDLYEQKGIHPAEVAHDAQTDVTITQSILSADKKDMPKTYGEAPKEAPEDILTERQPSSAGAAAVEPPAYSDAEQQILSKISIDEKSPQAKLTWDKLYTRVFDKLYPIGREVKKIAPDLPAEDNPYQLARLLTGHVGKADHFLNQATFDFNTYEANGPSLKEILNPVKDDLNSFRAYAAAARALELEGRGVKSGFDTGEASAPPLVSAGLDAARTVVVEGRERFEQPFRELIAYQNRVSGYLRDSGVLSDAGYKAMVEANKMYVPFTRVMGIDEAENRFRIVSGPTLQATNPIKAIKGSARSIVDPIESVVRNTYHMIEMAEKNVVGTKLVDMLKNASAELPEAPAAAEAIASKETPRAGAMAEALGEVGVKKADELASALAHASEPLREGEIAILRDGKRETYRVDPELANAMKGLDAQSIGMLEKALTYPASVLRAGAVTTPDFALRHTIRDFLYAATTFKDGVFTPLDMARGFGGLIMKDADYWNWLKGGGGNISMVGLDRQYLQADLRELTGKTGLAARAWNVLIDPNASMWQRTTALPKLPFQAFDKFILDPLRTLTQLAENASHLGAFKKTMRGMEESGPQDLRSQIIRSAWLSRDTAVDAARMGASMRAYNMITAFANIKLQDTDRVVRAIADNPISSLTKIGGAITVPSVILWSLNHDDPDYQEIAQWQKDMFWIVPIGSTAPSPLHIKQAEDRGVAPTNSALFFARIPKPWAMGMIFGTAPERLLDAYVDHKPEAFRDYWKKLWETSGPEFVPTGAAPIIDQFANRSTFTNRTLIPSAQEKFLPEYQYTPYTTELSKEVGKAIGAFPGMTTMKMENSGWGGVARAMTSPILIENYVRGWTGTLGNYIMQAADAGLRKANVLPDPPKPTSTLADIPIIRAFVVRYPSATTESVQEFQDEYAKAKSLFTTYEAMAKDGNVAAMEHIRSMTDDMTLFGQLDGMHETVSNLNQVVRDIYKNPSMPPDEKRQLIDQLYFGMVQVSREGMKTIHQIREKAANTLPTIH